MKNKGKIVRFMNYQNKFKQYLTDLGSKKPAPGGGSAVALGFLLGLALAKKAINYSLGDDKAKITKILQPLDKLNSKILNYIDLDGKIFLKIMQTPKEKRKPLVEDSQNIIIDLGKSCCNALTILNSKEKLIKKCIISDYNIGKGFIVLALKGCLENLQANKLMFRVESRYNKIFKKYLNQVK